MHSLVQHQGATVKSGATGSEKKKDRQLHFRPIKDQDYEFLCSVYLSTRWDEMALTGWPAEQITQFLRSQFQLQHTQYLRNYENPSFDVIVVNGIQAGRLYVDRRKDGMRLIDIALLPEFRGQGVGSKIIGDLIHEADRKRLPLSLHVEYNNPVLGFYERLGFRKINMNGVYFFMKREPVIRFDKKNPNEKGAVMIEKLKISNFHPHAGEKFEVGTKSGGKVILELVEVKDTSTDMMESFHLIFRGPREDVFPHDTHQVKHPKIGSFDLFLGPVIYGATDGVYYQAVFNRMKAAAKRKVKAAGKAAKKPKKTAAKAAGKKAKKPAGGKAGKAAARKKR